MSSVTVSHNKGFVFVCQITDNCVKLIKCTSAGSGRKTKFVSLACEPFASPEESKIKEALSAALKSLGYSGNSVVLSLPRQNATLRYLKIPAQSPHEIENIISLQAPRFLPYSAEELITAYQVVSVDKEGYTHVNLVIAHKDIIERYLKLFRALNIKDVNVVLSSFGLVNFFNYADTPSSAPAVFIDIEIPSVEVAVASGEKLLFSRSFKLSPSEADPAEKLSEEINKSIDSYVKEAQGARPEKAVICGAAGNADKLAEGLAGQLSLPVEKLSCRERITASADFLNKVGESAFSFVSLMGLGMQGAPESFSLLPKQIKSALRTVRERKELVRLSFMVAAVLLVFMSGFYRSMDNKRKYLERLGVELKKVAAEAGVLEKIEKRSKLIESRSQKTASSMDILYAVYKLIPEGVSLTGFIYEDEGNVLLRGQSSGLNLVFGFASKLAEDKFFRDFKPKVRYATKKKNQAGEYVDFEIACSRK